jgi:hypothetical protein
MSAAIARTQRVHPLTPVAAYPELIYGWSPFLGRSSRQTRDLRFPIAVARRPDLLLGTDYRLCGSCLSRGPIDLAYDLWISRDRFPVWCGHGSAPPPGCVPIPSSAIEVMIWLAHSPRFHPAGRPQPFSPGGRLRFRAYVCESCSHDIVSFVLAGSAAGPLPRGLLRGSLALPLDDFLAGALHALGRSGGYLNGIELGSEVAPASEGDAVRFWFTLRRYWLSSG